MISTASNKSFKESETLSTEVFFDSGEDSRVTEIRFHSNSWSSLKIVLTM